jgi:VWFA-related protein
MITLRVRPLPLASALLLAGWTSIPASAAPPPAAPSFGETVEVNVVNVEVYVTDRAGHRVNGLTKNDFTLSEDGRKAEVANFLEVQRKVQATPAVAGGSSPAAATAVASPAAVASGESAMSLVIFVDDVHIRPEHRTRAVDQIRKFLRENVRAGDQVMLATYDTRLHDRQTFTADRDALDTALQEVERLPSYGQQDERARVEAYKEMINLYVTHGSCTSEVLTPVQSYAEQARADALRTIGALSATVGSLSGVPGRKALLYVSDGVAVTPGEELYEAADDLCSGKMVQMGFELPKDRKPLGDTDDPDQYDATRAPLDAQKYSVAKPFEDLAARASANRVTFYTLQASGLQGNAAAEIDSDDSGLLSINEIQSTQTNNLKGSLTALAADTGGRAILDANDMLPELARMEEDFDSYYSLGYTPGHSGDGKVHHVEVKVKRPGLIVRYRQSYRDEPSLQKMADRTLATLFYGFEENPLDVAVEIGEATLAEKGEYAVPVRLRIPLFKLAILNQQATYQGKLRLMVATRDDAGGASPLRQVDVPLNIPRKEVLNAMGQYYVYVLTLHMKPGVQHVAVSVRDELATTTSYLSRPVTVAATAAVIQP